MSLQSGRDWLRLKITEYTYTFIIKIFSRNDEDKETFKSITKGIWVKVRGRIQTDNYTNELTMMMNDLNEIKIESKIDEASPDNKRVELHSHTMMSEIDAVVSASDLVERAA